MQPSTPRWLQLALGVACMVLIANLQYGWTLFVRPMHDSYDWNLADIQAALPGEEVVAEFVASFVPQKRLRSTPTHPLVHQLNQTWFYGDHAVLPQLPHRHVQPMCYRRGCSILRGDDAAGVQSAEFSGAQATLEQHSEDGADLFERHRRAKLVTHLRSQLLGR